MVCDYDINFDAETANAVFIAAHVGGLFSHILAVLAGLVVTVRNPSLLKHLVHAYKRGRATKYMSPVYWERMWNMPLDEVRRRLGLPPQTHRAFLIDAPTPTLSMAH